jgi:hypothetical protein
MHSKTKEEVAINIWKYLILHTGGGVTLVADADSAITTEMQLHLLATYGVNIEFIPIRTPWRNGGVERFMRVINDHLSKALVGGVLIPDQWPTWILQLTAIYNATYNLEIGHTPYFFTFMQDYPSGFMLGEIDGSKETDTNPASMLAQLISAHHYFRDEFRRQLLRQNKYEEVSRILAGGDAIPNFATNDWVLLHLGDSNGHYTTKSRCHAGPFKVLNRVSSSSYSICGADSVPVIVAAVKLNHYVPTIADMLGNGSLAASASGAAWARVLQFQQRGDQSEGIV